MENRHHFYFVITIIAILAINGFIGLKILDANTEFTMIEGSLYSIVRSTESRLSAEINYVTEEIKYDILESELENIDSEINNL